MKYNHVTRAVLPDGTAIKIEGGDAESTAAYLAQRVGVKPVTPAQPRPKPQSNSSTLTMLRSLLGDETQPDAFTTNEQEALELPSTLPDDAERSSPLRNEAPVISRPKPAPATANADGEEPLELPEMKFDPPEFMQREFKPDNEPSKFAQRHDEEALELPDPILGN